MGWESGCFPASVMITCTGLWPSGKIERKTSGKSRRGMNKAAISYKRARTFSKTYSSIVLPVKRVGESYFLVSDILIVLGQN